MTVSVTLQFADIRSAAAALHRLSGEQHAEIHGDGTGSALPLLAGHAEIRVSALAHADRPDIGAPEAPLPPVVSADVAHAAAVFGGAAALAAPTAPAPQAPTAPTLPTAATAPTAAPGAVERDVTGLPWDARIHAGSKTRVASGAWTSKRNLDPVFKAQIEADLRGVAAPVAPAAAMPAPPPPVFQPPVAPVAPVAQAGEGFAQYMARIGLAFTNRPIDAHNLMAAALAPHGLQHVGQLAGRPDLIPAVDAEFQRLLMSAA